MHTFSIVLVLFLEQHVIFFAGINLLVVHSETSNNLLLLLQVFYHIVLRWDDINNKLHDIVVALIREIIL
jgi:hypothetical protein